MQVSHKNQPLLFSIVAHVVILFFVEYKNVYIYVQRFSLFYSDIIFFINLIYNTRVSS